jgi:hypothetical protein
MMQKDRDEAQRARLRWDVTATAPDEQHNLTVRQAAMRRSRIWPT